MPAVRYVALAALVVWVGLTVVALAGDLGGDLLVRFPAIAVACGAIVLVALFVMKFVGPPPRAFVIRAGVVVVMLAVALYVWLAPTQTAELLAVNAGLGFLLLYWYSNE